jgi:hypothetical protein
VRSHASESAWPSAAATATCAELPPQAEEAELETDAAEDVADAAAELVSADALL